MSRCRARPWKTTCRFCVACCKAITPAAPTFAPTWSARDSGATATYSWRTSGFPPIALRAARGLAAVVWDASENLRDREGAGLDSMMATSRVLIGAISHEIRNLASAAASAHAALVSAPEVGAQRSIPGAGDADPRPGEDRLLRPARGFRPRTRRSPTWARCWTKRASSSNPPCARPAFRSPGRSSAELPLVQADHHSLLQVFVNLLRRGAQRVISLEKSRLAPSQRERLTRRADEGRRAPPASRSHPG